MQTNKDFQQHQGLLNGIGQIYFTPTIITSVLFLIAISVESFSLSALTLFGAASSYVFACYTRKPIDNIYNGMYALNGALVALFIGNMLEITPVLVMVTFLGALFTVPIATVVFGFKKYLGYTSAFVITSWWIYVAQWSLDITVFSPSAVEQAPHTHIATNLEAHLPPFIVTMLKGVSQVSFINNTWTGLIILVAIMLNNIQHALWVVLAVAVSTLFSEVIGADDELIAQGLYGYNAVLATLALVLYPRVSWVWVILGGVFSCLFTLIFYTLSLLPLTAPFILSTWAMVYLSSKRHT
ncbi:urea transporter [Vibrio sp. Isolate31]|uniref:urea transporter n=1 Tax=unclassified Vibrio TaxID=2614977 RepID=UPI001EFE7EE9|nr:MULTISPECIES: urea transporter [unclassified Vibrio]MCG9554532.1 urea transporter [Vibrio sp. Isolate32]MCG9602078.1 urea transporter [Vibrio sp. Isolate31]